jgi:DNA-directed RNA polymerase alpha subunit
MIWSKEVKMMLNYDVLNIRSKTVGFDNRICNALEGSNIRTMGQLRELSRTELNSLPNLGVVSINNIKAKLKEFYETDDPVLASINVRLERIERMLEKLV